MIEAMSDLPEGTLGFSISGEVTGDEYERTLMPTVEEAIAQHERIKLLVHFKADFQRYALDAMWDDTRVGLRHWRGFQRIAIAADHGWIRGGVKAMGFMLPCPVRLFGESEVDDARRWLQEALGSIQLDSDGQVVIARLIGKLEASAYDSASADIDGLMSGKDDVRLLLDLREFDGWSGLDALSDHLSLVREHVRVPKRIAVVGDRAWEHLAEKVMSRFTDARTKFFTGDDYHGAQAWVSA